MNITEIYRTDLKYTFQIVIFNRNKNNHHQKSAMTCTYLCQAQEIIGPF